MAFPPPRDRRLCCVSGVPPAVNPAVARIPPAVDPRLGVVTRRLCPLTAIPAQRCAAIDGCSAFLSASPSGASAAAARRHSLRSGGDGGADWRRSHCNRRCVSGVPPAVAPARPRAPPCRRPGSASCCDEGAPLLSSGLGVFSFWARSAAPSLSSPRLGVVPSLPFGPLAAASFRNVGGGGEAAVRTVRRRSRQS